MTSYLANSCIQPSLYSLQFGRLLELTDLQPLLVLLQYRLIVILQPHTQSAQPLTSPTQTLSPRSLRQLDREVYRTYLPKLLTSIFPADSLEDLGSARVLVYKAAHLVHAVVYYYVEALPQTQQMRRGRGPWGSGYFVLGAVILYIGSGELFRHVMDCWVGEGGGRGRCLVAGEDGSGKSRERGVSVDKAIGMLNRKDNAKEGRYGGL